VTQPGYRHRIIIQDRSGSMRSIIKGAQSGISEFFSSEEAVTAGRATYSLWDFDAEIRCLHQLAPLSAVRDYVIQPRGMTAMYDAIAVVVINEGELLAALPEHDRPEDVTVIIASDGLENHSVRYSRESGGGPRVQALLVHQQEKYGWRVLYMGTNQDAFREAATIGVATRDTLSYVNTSAGAANAWSASSSLLSRAPVASAAPCGQGFGYTQEERSQGESAEPQAPSA
jgi:hypothetical protein